MIARRNFFYKLAGGFAAAALVPMLSAAESKSKRRHAADAASSPTPSPSTPPESVKDSDEKKASSAKLRLWKATDAPTAALQIQLLPSGKAEKAISPLKIEALNYQFSEYVEVPTGPMIAEVSAPDRPALQVLLPLVDGSLSTLLIRQLGTGLSAEWMDDTPPPAENGYEFGVYNLLPASGDVQVNLGDVLNARLTSTRSNLRLRGLKRAVYPIVVNGTDGGGKNFRWNTEADFRSCRKAVLLIYLDLYGRVRPRIHTA